MKSLLQKDLSLLGIISLPFLYLAYIWNELPDKVPMHWNIKGEIDRYGDKAELILVPVLLPLLVYIIFLIIPKIDPKNKLEKMGRKFQTFKMILVIFTSLLALFILYAVKNESIGNPNYIFMGIGVLFFILGNFFQTIKPNYFMGIRTPWTLENEIIWKKTHILAGKMWFVGGLLIVFLCMILNPEINIIAFLVITGIISLVPIIYSYLLYKRDDTDFI